MTFVSGLSSSGGGGGRQTADVMRLCCSDCRGLWPDALHVRHQLSRVRDAVALARPSRRPPRRVRHRHDAPGCGSLERRSTRQTSSQWRVPDAPPRRQVVRVRLLDSDGPVRLPTERRRPVRHGQAVHDGAHHSKGTVDCGLLWAVPRASMRSSYPVAPLSPSSLPLVFDSSEQKEFLCLQLSRLYLLGIPFVTAAFSAVTLRAARACSSLRQMMTKRHPNGSPPELSRPVANAVYAGDPLPAPLSTCTCVTGSYSMPLTMVADSALFCVCVWRGGGDVARLKSWGSVCSLRSPCVACAADTQAPAPAPSSAAAAPRQGGPRPLPVPSVPTRQQARPGGWSHTGTIAVNGQAPFTCPSALLVCVVTSATHLQWHLSGLSSTLLHGFGIAKVPGPCVRVLPLSSVAASHCPCVCPA